MLFGFFLSVKAIGQEISGQCAENIGEVWLERVIFFKQHIMWVSNEYIEKINSKITEKVVSDKAEYFIYDGRDHIDGHHPAGYQLRQFYPEAAATGGA